MQTPTAYRQYRTRTRFAAGLVTAVLTIPGCTDHTKLIRNLERSNASLRSKVSSQREQLIAQQATIDGLRATLDADRDFGDRDLSRIYRVSDITIGRLSGGWDRDGEIGDEGVTVFLQLRDGDGQPFKAAGQIDITLLDVDHDPPVPLHACHYDIDQARELWYGQLMSYHYKIRCAWGAERPTGRTVVVRATFTEYLTGQPFQAVRTLEITPPMPAVGHAE